MSESTESQLPVVIAKQRINPKPTRHQVVLAMAQAVFDKKKEEWEAAGIAAAEAHKKLMKLCFKMAKKKIASSKFEDVDVAERSWRSDDNQLFVEVGLKLDIKDNLEIADLMKKSKNNVPRPHFESILKRIKQAKPGHDPVKAMLDVPELRKALLEGGTKLMADPSDKDRSKAIEVTK